MYVQIMYIVVPLLHPITYRELPPPVEELECNYIFVAVQSKWGLVAEIFGLQFFRKKGCKYRERG